MHLPASPGPRNPSGRSSRSQVSRTKKPREASRVSAECQCLPLKGGISLLCCGLGLVHSFKTQPASRAQPGHMALTLSCGPPSSSWSQPVLISAKLMKETAGKAPEYGCSTALAGIALPGSETAQHRTHTASVVLCSPAQYSSEVSLTL